MLVFAETKGRSICECFLALICDQSFSLTFNVDFFCFDNGTKLMSDNLYLFWRLMIELGASSDSEKIQVQDLLFLRFYFLCRDIHGLIQFGTKMLIN